MPISVTQEQILSFIFNDVSKKVHDRIVHAINTDKKVREVYLSEKRMCDAERYIYDDMNIKEKIEFEELLKEQPSLNEYFNLSSEVDSYLKTDLFSQRLSKLHMELYGSTKLVRKAASEKVNNLALKYGNWLVAASIVLFIGLSATLYVLEFRDTSVNRLYAKYHKPVKRDISTFFNSASFNEAKNRYFNKEYDLALMLIENLPNSLTIESEKLLYKGLVLMELNRFDEAIETFETIKSKTTFKGTNPTINWHLALCYLKVGKQQNAKALLERIVQYNYENYKKANQILMELNYQANTNQQETKLKKLFNYSYSF